MVSSFNRHITIICFEPTDENDVKITPTQQNNSYANVKALFIENKVEISLFYKMERNDDVQLI